jgi:hypothetical protein
MLVLRLTKQRNTDTETSKMTREAPAKKQSRAGKLTEKIGRHYLNGPKDNKDRHV